MILNILPYLENYDRRKCGSISYSVANSIRRSEYGLQTYVLGSQHTDTPTTLNYIEINSKRRFTETKSKAYLRGCVEFANKNNVSLIEVHDNPMWVNYIKRKCSAPITWHLHRNPSKMFFAKSSRQREELIDKCAKVVCANYDIKEQLLAGITNPEMVEKVSVVLNTLDIARTVDLSKKQKLIVFVGEVTQNKDIQQLSSTLLDVLTSNPDWKSLIIDTSLKKSLFDKSSSALGKAIRKLPGQIIHYRTRSQPEAISWIKEASIALLTPISEESFEGISIESAKNGCAIITSKDESPSDVLHGATIHVSNLRPEFLSYSLNNLIQNPTRRFDFQQKSLKAANDLLEAYDATQNLDTIRHSIINN